MSPERNGAPAVRARKAPGAALEWTEADLDALSQVSPQDVAEAQAWVSAHADPLGEQLWNAETVDEDD
jgi:hypothetical protein